MIYHQSFVFFLSCLGVLIPNREACAQDVHQPRNFQTSVTLQGYGFSIVSVPRTVIEITEFEEGPVIIMVTEGMCFARPSWGNSPDARVESTWPGTAADIFAALRRRPLGKSILSRQSVAVIAKLCLKHNGDYSYPTQRNSFFSVHDLAWW